MWTQAHGRLMEKLAFSPSEAASAFKQRWTTSPGFRAAIIGSTVAKAGSSVYIGHRIMKKRREMKEQNAPLDKTAVSFEWLSRPVTQGIEGAKETLKQKLVPGGIERGSRGRSRFRSLLKTLRMVTPREPKPVR